MGLAAFAQRPTFCCVVPRKRAARPRATSAATTCWATHATTSLRSQAASDHLFRSQPRAQPPRARARGTTARHCLIEHLRAPRAATPLANGRARAILVCLTGTLASSTTGATTTSDARSHTDSPPPPRRGQLSRHGLVQQQDHRGTTRAARDRLGTTLVARHDPRATTSLPRSVGTTSAAAVSSSSPAAAPAESQLQSP